MSSRAISETKLTLKLLVDTNGQKVLFAEAGKDFIDFLLTLLSLPLGTVIRLLSSNAMVGTLGKLYDSFKDLNDTYIQPNINKDTLLKPASSLGSSPAILSLTNDTGFTTHVDSQKTLFICNSCRTYESDDSRARCPSCSRLINSRLLYVAPPKDSSTSVGSSTSEGGFVKGVVTYMLMDDLEVKPMSTISSIAILNGV